MGLFSRTKLKMTDVGDIPTVAEPMAYMNDVWRQQQALYQEMWRYFSGEVFDETLSKRSDDLKYPLRENVFATACFNHRAVLYGEFDDAVLSFQVKSKNADRQTVEDALEQMWSDSYRNSLLLENGLLSQIFGGHVLRAVYHPVYKRVFFRGVEVTTFFPVWNPDDYHELLEVFVVYPVDARTAALRWNLNMRDIEDGQQVIVQEHWTQDKYEFTVDGKPAYWDRGHKFKIGGPNPYIDPDTERGIIPFEYFPLDRAGSFYGIPLGKDALGLQDEYNKRAADMGDAVMEATHMYKFLVGRSKGTKGLEHLDRVGLNDLGMEAPGRPAPEVFTVDSAKIPTGAPEWVAGLRGGSRAAMFDPAIAHGEDEGSQRSMLTLAFRMWPMTSKVRATRGLWNECFRSLHRKALIMAAAKGGYNIHSGRKQHTYYTVPLWSPMLPRDREQQVNEVVLRVQTGIISRERAIEILENKDSTWIAEEIARIKADEHQQDDRQIKVQEAQQKQQQMAMRQAGAKPPKSKE